MPALLTILFGLVYAILLIWIILHYNTRFNPNVSGNKKTPYRLANTLRIILNIFLCLTIFGVLMAPLFYYVYPAISHFFNPSFLKDKNMFMDMHSYFKLDLTMLPALEISGLEKQVINGKASLYIIPSKLILWHIYEIMEWARMLFNCYVIFQLRNIFTTICNGETFNGLITSRLKKTGIAIIGWNVASPLVQYFGNDMILKDISVNSQAMKLTSYFYVGVEYIFIGMALLVLSGVMKEAIRIHNEQRLTI